MEILIAQIILGVSFIGIVIILFRKIPVLIELPETFPQTNREGLIVRVKKIPVFKSFSFRILLQKIVSLLKTLTLKTDNKTGSWLEKLQQRSKKQESGLDQKRDDYWEELKKAKNGK